MAPCNRLQVDQSGFSYLWVLLLVAFMSLGLSLAIEAYVTASQRERELELISIGRQFRTAIGSYYELGKTGGKGGYPASLDELLKDSRTPGIKRHLRRVFVDPMTGKAEWGLVKVGGRIVGVHSLSQGMPIKQSGFEPDEISLTGKKTYSEWLFMYPANLTVQPGAMKDLGALQSPVATSGMDAIPTVPAQKRND